jgi:hypothetical protein
MVYSPNQTKDDVFPKPDPQQGWKFSVKWRISVILSHRFCWQNISSIFDGNRVVSKWLTMNEACFNWIPCIVILIRGWPYRILEHTDDLKAIERGVKNAFRWTWPVNFYMEVFHSKNFQSILWWGTFIYACRLPLMRLILSTSTLFNMFNLFISC